MLFGATGFTGKLVAEYFRDYSESPMRIGLAGRNLKKLEAVQREHGDPSWQLIEADVSDQASLDAMAAKTKVVCTTVGPYAKYGQGVVAACVENGANYCDLTGETHFIREMIDSYHERAVENGVAIVNCCGFDSIPSDLGTYILQEHAIAEHGHPCRVVNMYVTRMKGGFSGGTVASVKYTVDLAKNDREFRKFMVDPYAINPLDDKPELKQRDQNGAVLADDLGLGSGDENPPVDGPIRDGVGQYARRPPKQRVARPSLRSRFQIPRSDGDRVWSEGAPPRRQSRDRFGDVRRRHGDQTDAVVARQSVATIG